VTTPTPPPAASARRRLLVSAVVGATLLGAGITAVLTGSAAFAAGEQVGIQLTSTSDAGGRVVTRGLAAQTPVTFAATSAAASTTITVDEATRYQQFEGAGASFTDSAADLLRGGTISAATRDAVMARLFGSAGDGIGLSFVRNPIGASDLARPGHVSLDDTCCDLGDFGANGYDGGVRLLTQQAKTLNPALRTMGAPWSAPGWMKDNGRMDQMGWLKWEYYPMYAQYLVKYIQSYQAAGVKLDYISVQNEPNCCHADNPAAQDYPGMNWNAGGLIELTKNHVYPAFRAAGITTKVLVHDWNYGDYAAIGQPILADAAVRTDPLFGGIAWHGYFGDPAVGNQVHNEYPAVSQFSTEHSGGTWVGNQHNDDLTDIITYGRNWSRSIVKWGLALNQNMGPHNGGCGTCTPLVTVQQGGSRAGQVDYTVEFYTTGHLTKFVKPGAYRIASNDSTTIRNIAYRNADGSKALIAHNGGGSAQSVKVVWGGQSFTYTLPARTTATFTWTGTPSTGGTTPPPAGPSGAFRSDLNGKCVDVKDNSSADGQPMQMWTCAGSANQSIQRAADGTLRVLGKCLDVSGGVTTNGAPVVLLDLSRCHEPAVAVHGRAGHRERAVRHLPRHPGQQRRRRRPAADLDLRRRGEPEVVRTGVSRPCRCR
jgi:glucosylceramidase